MCVLAAAAAAAHGAWGFSSRGSLSFFATVNAKTIFGVQTGLALNFLLFRTLCGIKIRYTILGFVCWKR